MSGPGFSYARAADAAEAVRLGSLPGTAFIAGGTDLLQLWKAGVVAPGQVIDISRLPLDRIIREGEVLRLGALARLADAAAETAGDFPLISEAIAASASGQIRNMASVGGNLMQRTRCVYFRGEAALPCNKRAPGSGCGALQGENRQSALFGAGPACVATHASDLAVALAALDADVEVLSSEGSRRLTLEALYRLPGEAPERDTTLTAGELITEVSVRRFDGPSTYLKVRDRASFDFAVVSVAAALRLEDGVIAEARLAAGGVAAMPWRLRACEAALVGRPAISEIFAEAADLATDGAEPLAHNGFKLTLLRNAVRRALETVGGRS